jgi:tRNA (adenine37-N6)-methyltransferase
MQITYTPIGIIHSPFTELSGMPIQPTSGNSATGYIDIYPEFVEGLKGLDGFSHIYLIYHLHKATQAKLTITPFLDTETHGVFATRAPSRPNPIGLSLIKLVSIDQARIHIEQIDVLDGTPLLDLKPFVPTFEDGEDIRIGWLAKASKSVQDARADHRFLKKS